MFSKTAKRPARTKTPRLSPEARRDALLKAARRCLSKRGVGAFNLKNIAGEAGVSIGLIGHYFGGIDEIKTAVFLSVMFELPGVKQGRRRNISGALADLLGMIESNFADDYYSRENLLVWLPIYEEMLINAKTREKLNEKEERYIKAVALVIGRVAELRGIDIDANRVAYNFLALLDGLWLRWCHSSRHDVEYEKGVAIEYLETILGPLRTAAKM
jgi:TetR/AcrR family transcriptional regulator, transcriptional repressor of bet genes